MPTTMKEEVFTIYDLIQRKYQIYGIITNQKIYIALVTSHFIEKKSKILVSPKCKSFNEEFQRLDDINFGNTYLIENDLLV